MLKIKNLLLSAAFFFNFTLVFVWAFEAGIQELPVWLKVAGRLHPMLLHFPIAILLITALLELIVKQSDEKEKITSFFLAITAFTAAVTALCGFFLLHGGGYEASSDLYWHKIAGIFTSIVTCALLWLRSMRKTVYLTVLISSCILLVVTGHLGSAVTHGKDFVTEPLKVKAKKISDIKEAFVYPDIIQPIFDEKCTGCHNPNKRKGSLLLTNYNEVLKGGENGAVFFPGNADSSALFTLLLLPPDDDRHMPPEGKPQPDADEIALIKWWIQAGANPKQKFKDAVAPDSINKIVQKKYNAGSPLDQLNIPFADQEAINKLSNNDRVVRQLSLEKPFVDVFMANRKKIENKEFEELTSLNEQITAIDLSYSFVTLEQVKKLSSFPHLRAVHLQNSNINDSAVRTLMALKYLEYLNLSGTAVTDAVLDISKEIKMLKKLYLYETAVSADKITSLKKSLPEITIGYTPDLSVDTLYRGRLTEPTVTIDSNMFLNHATVEMTYRLKGVNLHYTLDGSNPDSTSPVYKTPLEINKSCTLKVNAMRSGWIPGKTLRFGFEKAAHKFARAVLDSVPDKKYAARLDTSLIDLKRGSTDPGDGNFLGFYGHDMTALLDLGNTTQLTALSLSYLTDHGSIIFSPVKFEAWTATADGKKIKSLGTISRPESKLKKQRANGTLTVKFAKQSVRWIIVKATNTKKAPSWHPAKGAKTWIFIDEIIPR
jgi:uncharacterized membrane protein